MEESNSLPGKQTHGQMVDPEAPSGTVIQAHCWQIKVSLHTPGHRPLGPALPETPGPGPSGVSLTDWTNLCGPLQAPLGQKEPECAFREPCMEQPGGWDRRGAI